MRFKDRVVIVTGGTSGIGRATALAFGREGGKVIATGRREERLKETVDSIREAGGEGAYVVADITSESDNERVVKDTIAKYGGLDVLVNNAGVIGTGGIEDTPPEEWDRQMSINLRGPYLLTRAAIPHLKKSAHGAIVNVSSVCGVRPFGTVAAYCVSKAGVDMLTRCLALELAPHKVRVNAVNPGVVVSELHTVTKAVDDYDAFLERSAETHPLGRVGKPRSQR